MTSVVVDDDAAAVLDDSACAAIRVGKVHRERNESVRIV